MRQRYQELKAIAQRQITHHTVYGLKGKRPTGLMMQRALVFTSPIHVRAEKPWPRVIHDSSTTAWAAMACFMINWKRRTSVDVTAIIQSLGDDWIEAFRRERALSKTEFERLLIASAGLGLRTIRDPTAEKLADLISRMGPLYILLPLNGETDVFSGNGRVLVGLVPGVKSEETLAELIDLKTGTGRRVLFADFIRQFASPRAFLRILHWPPHSRAGISPPLMPVESAGQTVSNALDYSTTCRYSSSLSANDDLSLSKRGLEFISRHEGFRPSPYNCPGGHCTIGYGHLIHHGNCDGSEPEKFKNGLTRDQALALLKNDASIAEQIVRKRVTVSLSQTQFDALVSFVFNIGDEPERGFQSSQALEFVNEKRFSEVPAKMALYNRSGGMVIKALVTRRRDEGNLFANGDYGDSSTILSLAASNPTEEQARRDARTVLEYIKTEAQKRALSARSVDATSNFYKRLTTFYLADYLASPSAVNGKKAIEKIGKPFAGPVTQVVDPQTGQLGPDKWEEGALTAWNRQTIPEGFRQLRPSLPATIEAGTDILSVANRALLSHIDVPFLVGQFNPDTSTINVDVEKGGKNISQLMHWATGVKYYHIDSMAMREFFLAYELWHLEAWDVFGEDPINDLIAEDAGRILGVSLAAAGVNNRTLLDKLNASFSEARAWVGSLLRQRRSDFDSYILSETPIAAAIWWGQGGYYPIWGNETIYQRLLSGKPIDEVKQWQLTQRFTDIYALLYEADEWEKKRGAIAQTTFIENMLKGEFNDIFRKAVQGIPLTSNEQIRAYRNAGGTSMSVATLRRPAVQAFSLSNALSAIATFAAGSAAGAWPYLNRAAIATRLKELVNNPMVLQQGSLNLCGPAAFFYIWLKRDPEAVVNYAVQLFEKGAAKIGSKEIDPDSDLTRQNYSAVAGRMNVVCPQAEWMMMSALRDASNSIIDFEGTPEESVAGITTPGELSDWLRLIGQFRSVSDQGNWVSTKPLSHALGLSPSSTTDVALLINAHILDQLNIVKGAKKSSDFILNAFPNHFIVLTKAVTLSSDVVSLECWTWGGFTVGTVAKSTFQANYYGAVIASV